jgi:hypothetical protein
VAANFPRTLLSQWSEDAAKFRQDEYISLSGSLTELVAPELLVPDNSSREEKARWKREIVDKYITPANVLRLLLAKVNKQVGKPQWRLQRAEKGKAKIGIRGFTASIEKHPSSGIWNVLATYWRLAKYQNSGSARSAGNSLLKTDGGKPPVALHAARF